MFKSVNPPHVSYNTVTALSSILVTNLIQVVRGSWTKGLKCREKRGMEAVKKKVERDEAKRLHPSTGSKKNKKLKAEQPTGWTLTDSQTRSGKTELTIHLQVETEKCTTALVSKVMRQPCRQEEEAGVTEGESRNKREKKIQRSAKRHHAVDRLG